MMKVCYAEHRNTVAVYDINDFLPLLKSFFNIETQLLVEGRELRTKFTLPSDRVISMTPRLRTFCVSGVKCCGCSNQANWVVEKKKQGNNHSLLLFLVDAYSRSPMPITADHVIPASLGGPSDIGNLVPLCNYCNCRKDNRETHLREKRWRLRTLFEACLIISNDVMDMQERYDQFKSICFNSVGRSAAAYGQEDAQKFINSMCAQGNRPKLEDITCTYWPLTPDLEKLVKDPWLEALAMNTQTILDQMFNKASNMQVIMAA
jgi:hypothetical protein